MPTDFVAKWLSFMGKIALFWTGLREPDNERDRDFLLLSLGWTSLAVCILLLVSIMPMFAGTLSEILSLENDAEWVMKAGTVAERVLSALFLGPILVGFLYRPLKRRHKRLGRFWSTAIVSFAFMVVGTVYLAATRDPVAGKAVFASSTIPVVIAFCPSYPHRKERSVTDTRPRRRYRLASRVTKISA